jgi:hypothetical protein
MKNQKTLIFCALLCVSLLCACFSTWDGSGGTVKLPIDIPDGDEKYTVILTSPGRSSIEIESAPPRDSTIVLDVPPGTWDIEIRVEDENGLTFLGDAEKVEVKPGETKEVPVTMYPATQVNKDKGFSDAFDYFEGREDIDEYVDDPNIENNSLCYIEIAEPITIDKPVTLSGGKNITLRTNDKITITRGEGFTQTLFRINEGSKLTLGGVGSGEITIRGNNGNNSSLITVLGELIMNDKVTITGNTISVAYPGDQNAGGGGVYVGKGGIFTMNGGKINLNTTLEGHGGGVRVREGTFTMNGGEINNNEAYLGGGVRLSIGTFTMNGGTISNNTAERDGGGVSVGERQTFTRNGGTVSDNDPDDIVRQ